MIKVFQATDKYFASNGDKIINPYKAVVFKEDNGDYYCDIEASIDLMDYLKQDMIACVQTPWGWQPFRCDKPEVNGKKVRVRAWHLYYDTENYVIADVNIAGSGCQAALNKLKGGCDSTLPFSVVSDIVDAGSFHCIRKTFADAVNDVLAVWGGHLDRDGWNIGIRANIGQDRGVTLAYGKNIREITAVENWDNVCTKILPVGKNEVTTGFLTSDTQYDLPYTKVVEFTQDLEQQEGEADEDFTARLQADLRVQAAQYLSDHALPEVNYTLKAHLQNVADVGDTIWVKHPKCQVDVETRVISVKWDAIKGEYKEIEFGNFRKKLSGLNSMVTAEIKKAEKTTESFVNEELRKATDKIMGVMGNSYVIYDGDKILILDKLPKEEAKNVIRINAGGIGFSSTGINGTFNSAWTIDGTFDAQQINVINLNADAIASGSIDAKKINVLNLVVGENVTMGANAVLTWDNLPFSVASIYDIPRDEEITKITQTAIQTGDIIIAGWIWDYISDEEAAAGTGNTSATKQRIIGINSSNNLQIGTIFENANYEKLRFYSPDIMQFYPEGQAAEDNYTLQLGVDQSIMWCDFVVKKGDIYMYNGFDVVDLAGNVKYAPASHSHSGYYGSGDIMVCQSIRPNTDGQKACGTSSYRWSNVYCENAEINTSDRKLKENIEPVSDKYIALFDRLSPVSYKLVSGDRTHIGFVSQDVEEKMAEVGLTDMDFGGFCKDIIKDEEGNEFERYGLRYSEFIGIMAAKIKQLEARLAAVEGVEN